MFTQSLTSSEVFVITSKNNFADFIVFVLFIVNFWC